MSKSDKILRWLKEHDLISINRLESKIDIPQRTIAKALEGSRNIPEKYIDSLVQELRRYGFN